MAICRSFVYFKRKYVYVWILYFRVQIAPTCETGQVTSVWILYSKYSKFTTALRSYAHGPYEYLFRVEHRAVLLLPYLTSIL